MGNTSLLVLALLISITSGQTTTVQTSLLSESEPSSSNVKETIATSDGTSPLKTSESTIRYSVLSPGDEKSEKDNPENDLGSDSSEEDTAELLLIESLIGASADQFEGDNLNETNDNKASEDNGFKFIVETNEDPIIASNTDGVEVRRQGEINPEFSRTSQPDGVLDEAAGNSNNPSSISPHEELTNDQSFRQNSNIESSPLLQLTQGGYQRPFQVADRFSNQQQRLRSESATQQAEAVETPNANTNSNLRTGNARSQVPYSAFQSPFGPRPEPVFNRPFRYQPSNLGSENGNLANYEQNPFFNTPVTGFSDFNQGHGNFPSVARDASISLFQTSPRPMAPSPAYIFQTPLQYPVSQPIPLNPSPISTYFQSSNSPSRFSNYENAAIPGAADFSGMFGNMAPMNPQFQDSSNLYGSTPSFGGNIFNNPPELTLLPNFPRPVGAPQLPPRFINYSPGRAPIQNTPPQRQYSNSPPSNENKKQNEQMDVPMNKEDSTTVPFGTRIQRQNDGEPRNDFERQDDVYIRYPMTEAGYATEENLPLQNATDKTEKDTDTPLRPSFPFFSTPRRFNYFNSPDPYKAALANVQRGFPSEVSRNNVSKNSTDETSSEQRFRDLPQLANQLRPDSPPQIFRSYPERNPDLSIPNIPFYQVQGVNPDQDPFAQPQIFPGNGFQFPMRPRSPSVEEPKKIPECAKKSNSSFCFEDPDYPKGDLLYTLNSDSFLADRFIMPDRQLEDFPFVDTLENPDRGDNYVCNSDIKYGQPLRAQNIQGNWKIIVNVERAIGRGNFIQPVRLEICRGAGEPCNFTQVKTVCVQKYSLQRLLSWDAEKGAHSDVYKLPVACSCQVVEDKA